MKSIQQLINLSVLTLLLTVTASPTNYYVDKNVTSSGNGQSWATAWKNFSNISWNSIQPGDVIYISGGTDSVIYNQQLTVEASGSSGGGHVKIFAGRYSPSPSGHSGRVILSGGGYGIHISYQDYVWVRGLEVRWSRDKGVFVDNIADNCILDSLHIYDFNQDGGGSGFGIALIGLITNTTIRNCLVQDRVYGVGQSDCVHVNLDGGNTSRRPSKLVAYNNFFHCRSQDPMAHNDAFQVVGCDGLILYNNIMMNDSVNSGTEGGGMPFIISDVNYGADNPVIIFNNFAYMGGLWYPNANYGKVFNTRHDGVGGANSSNRPSKVFVFNNTLVNNGPRDFVVQQEYGIHFLSNNIIASYCLPDAGGSNNWRSGSNHGWFANLDGSDSYGGRLYMDSTRNNLLWRQDSTQSGLFAGSFNKPGGGTASFSNWSQWVAAGGTGLNRNPQFVNNFGHEPVQGALRPDLKPSSPAIDAGEDLTYLYNYFENSLGIDLPAMFYDINGNPRDNNWDIGAFEYNNGPDLTPPKVTGAILPDSVTLVVNFSEALDQTTAENKNNYSITNNINVLNASLSGSKVTLQTSPHSPGSYIVTVVNVEDLAGNPVDPAHNTAGYEYIVLPPDTLVMFPVQNVEGIIIEPDHTPEKTIDGLGALGGDPDSRWAAEPMPEELTFDLGTNRTVCRTKLSFYNWNDGRVYNYSISVSTNHNNWVSIVPQTTSAANQEWTIDDFPAVNARYVRVHFINNNQSNWAGLWEGEIWGLDIVPVELISFNAEYRDGKVNLEWSTATELNNLGFEIQRSENGIDFNILGFIEGHGTTTEMQNYSFTDNTLNKVGKYYYRLKYISNNGEFNYSSVIQVDIPEISTFQLKQNYPNPFNPSTAIEYYVPRLSHVKLIVYNMIGQEVQTLVNGEKAPGSYKIELNGANLPSGVYFYKLLAANYVETRKMILLR